MKRIDFLTAVLAGILQITIGFSQQFETKRVEKVLITNRSIYLKGGFRASFSGASRIPIKVDLPPNTVEWYYSFSTSRGESNSKNLGLGLQLAALIADTSTLTSSLLSKIKVPAGEAHLDVYLCNKVNIDRFIRKVDNNGGSYSFYREGSVKSHKQAIVQIDDILSGTWYLGLKNPSTSTGLNINIEVVAIVEERLLIEKTESQQKAEMYGNLALSYYNNGEYKKCIEFCDKSILKYETGQALVTKGLALLMQGLEPEATELMVDAIVVINKETNSSQTIEWTIKALNNIILFNWNLETARNIKKLYESQR